MVTRFALQQLRPVIVGFPISASVSKLFTVPTGVYRQRPCAAKNCAMVADVAIGSVSNR
jgi:hypothetical protein